MAEKLKACPFCGGTKISYSTHQIGIAVGCDSCGAVCEIKGSKEQCAEAWNTRAKLPSQGGEAVAWMQRNPEGDEVLSFYPRTPHEIATGWTETPLYTHPADQVAEPGAAQEIQWLEQWLLFAAEPIGQECCGQAYLECCGNAEPVYRTAGEISVAMNARREELRALLAKSEGVKK